MRKLIAIVLLSAVTVTVKAQEQPNDGPVEIHTLAQMLRLQATISPAWSVTLLSGGDSVASIGGGRTNVYIHATAEYYWDERFSTRSDAYYFVNKDDEAGGMKHNHGFQIGFSYHLIKRSNIDPFIGIRAGMNLTQINPMTLSTGLVTAENYPIAMHLDPTWAPVVGCNFYGQRIFHFFIEAALVQGTYRPNVGPQLSLEEVRVSAGLGWNISFYKPVDTVRQKI